MARTVHPAGPLLYPPAVAAGPKAGVFAVLLLAGCAASGAFTERGNVDEGADACEGLARESRDADAAAARGDWVDAEREEVSAQVFLPRCDQQPAVERYRTARAARQQGLARWRESQSALVARVRGSEDYVHAAEARERAQQELDAARTIRSETPYGTMGSARNRRDGSMSVSGGRESTAHREITAETRRLREQLHTADARLREVLARLGVQPEVAILLGLLHEPEPDH